ncbi:MAG: double zinc ribbon domain-containing protein, partial [Lactobacillales bacterium]|nr:double zinc ribbon domain-containing protein [Lactobacillales bacterium]
MSFFSFFLDLIFPPQCLNCKNETGGAGGLCGDCYAKIKFISDPVCVCCGKPFLPEESLYTHCGVCLAKRPFFTAAKSIFQYDDASKHMILAYKHM